MIARLNGSKNNQKVSSKHPFEKQFLCSFFEPWDDQVIKQQFIDFSTFFFPPRYHNFVHMCTKLTLNTFIFKMKWTLEKTNSMAKKVHKE